MLQPQNMTKFMYGLKIANINKESIQKKLYNSKTYIKAFNAQVAFAVVDITQIDCRRSLLLQSIRANKRPPLAVGRPGNPNVNLFVRRVLVLLHEADSQQWLLFCPCFKKKRTYVCKPKENKEELRKIPVHISMHSWT